MATRQGRPKALGTRNNSTRTTPVPANSSKPKCFNCCQFGHVAKYCRSKPFCPICKKQNHCLRDCRFKKNKQDNNNDNQRNKNQTNSNSSTSNTNRNANSSTNNNNNRSQTNRTNDNADQNKKNATCANCKKKGHLAKDCSAPRTQADGKKWPKDRASTPELTQLSKYSWSQPAIAEWTELVRLCEFEIFYAKQVKELALEIKNEFPTKFIFEHHFDGTKKELLLPSRNSEFNKAKHKEFSAGLNTIRLLQIKTVDSFRKEVAKMCLTTYDGQMNQALYLDSLPPHVADQIRNLDQRQQQAPQQERLLKIKQIGEYAESKIGELTMFFTHKIKEAESDAEIQFAIKRSRQDARNTANQAGRQLSAQEQMVIDMLQDAVNDVQIVQPPQVQPPQAPQSNQ